jgi:hypothetical protein
MLLPLLHAQGIGFPKGLTGWKPFVAIGLLVIDGRALQLLRRVG